MDDVRRPKEEERRLAGTDFVRVDGVQHRAFKERVFISIESRIAMRTWRAARPHRVVRLTASAGVVVSKRRALRPGFAAARHAPEVHDLALPCRVVREAVLSMAMRRAVTLLFLKRLCLRKARVVSRFRVEVLPPRPRNTRWQRAAVRAAILRGPRERVAGWDVRGAAEADVLETTTRVALKNRPWRRSWCGGASQITK